jgi:DnaJ-class molecular chaperone
MLRNRRPKDAIECPYCEGSQEVFDSRHVTSQSLDPPMTTCPACNGRGWVHNDEEIDCDRSIGDYEEEYEAEAAERRWEAKMDR